MEGPPPPWCEISWYVYVYIPFLTQGVRNPWTRHLTKKWRNRQRNHLSCTPGAPKRPSLFQADGHSDFPIISHVKKLGHRPIESQPFFWMDISGTRLHLSWLTDASRDVLFDTLRRLTPRISSMRWSVLPLALRRRTIFAAKTILFSFSTGGIS